MNIYVANLSFDLQDEDRTYAEERHAAPPPPAYSQAAEQGHHDGIEAARRDIANGAPPDPNRHPRFRNPPVPPPLMDDYRHAFGNGYEEVYRHGPPRGY